MAKKKGPPKEPSRRHGIHRFEEVLSAAEALITEGTPLDELTLQGVAKKAGVPRVSLYYFFPSVDALVEALYQRVLTRLMNELATAEAARGSLRVEAISEADPGLRDRRGTRHYYFQKVFHRKRRDYTGVSIRSAERGNRLPDDRDRKVSRSVVDSQSIQSILLRRRTVVVCYLLTTQPLSS
ncbi:MAG: TetR/AcrR family transcriptional regulator [Gammaproteobacteria bacterium]|nr:TetR/AcrR family transcriptional regulator [Gammaproteobacteria bacterium]